jgi:hypothetical protein
MLLKLRGTSMFVRVSLHVFLMTVYVEIGPFCFIDFQGLNDRVTSFVRTQPRWNFLSQIIARDGPNCLFTLEDEPACKAVHILPRSKRQRVASNRSSVTVNNFAVPVYLQDHQVYTPLPSNPMYRTSMTFGMKSLCPANCIDCLASGLLLS